MDLLHEFCWNFTHNGLLVALAPEGGGGLLAEFWHNFTHNLFKPLLLFFYMGFLVPLFRIELEFPHALYQALTIYLLVAIGWHGGEELAALSEHAGGGALLQQALGFMAVGFVTNFFIGLLAYLALRAFTRLRKVDAATVAGYYGSDSAGTFVTCVGVLTSLELAAKAAGNTDLAKTYVPAPYMPVMLAVMEIPGCLVALFLVSQLRREGMNRHGAMPGDAGYTPPILEEGNGFNAHDAGEGHHSSGHSPGGPLTEGAKKSALKALLDPKILHEVFLNPGLYLLFGSIAVGYVSRAQGKNVTDVDDPFLVGMFQGVLCLFLLEMGMTACKRLKDLNQAGWRFVVFGLVAPNVFATIGIVVAHLYSHLLGVPFELATYVLFAVLCGAASYIAVPAVQRLAIPEASPTLPLAASLGLTFSYNVTIGIPLYIMIAKIVMETWRVA